MVTWWRSEVHTGFFLFRGSYPRISADGNFGSNFFTFEIHIFNLCFLDNKHAAYHSMINRLLSIPLDSNAFRHEEGDIMKCIAENDFVNINIDNIIRKEMINRV